MYDVLRGAGVHASAVVELPSRAGVAELELTLDGEPTPGARAVANGLLRAFCGAEPRWEPLERNTWRLTLERPAPADLFELLGVGHTEDCYTDALAHGFRRHAPLRRRLLGLLGLGAYAKAADWSCRARVKVDVPGGRSRHGRSQVTPDLVLFSASSRAVGVIENKIGSGEGYGQTADYADAGVLDALANKLGVDRDGERTGLAFLTIDGVAPDGRSKDRARFEALGYESLIDFLPERGESALEQVLASMRARMSAPFCVRADLTKSPRRDRFASSLPSAALTT